MTSPSPIKSPDRDAADELERVARAISVARGLGPETLHQNYGPDEPVDAVLSTGAKAHYGWRHHVAVARAALDASELATLRRRVVELEKAAGELLPFMDEPGAPVETEFQRAVANLRIALSPPTRKE